MADKKKRMTDEEELALFDRILTKRAELETGKSDLESVINYFRERMGVPESHFPIKEVEPYSLAEEGVSARGRTRAYVRPGPLTTGVIEVEKGSGPATRVHELQHAKERKARSIPEYEKELEQREKSGKHFTTGKEGDPSGRGFDIEQILKLDDEIQSLLEDRMRKMKK